VIFLHLCGRTGMTIQQPILLPIRFITDAGNATKGAGETAGNKQPKAKTRDGSD
jgi:hypothetical protein